MTKRLTLKITGLVQGVGYRYSSQREAQRQGLKGYVKNIEDNCVEIVAEGEEEKLKDFINWCYNGVGTAVVYKIKQSWSKPTGEFSDFVIEF